MPNPQIGNYSILTPEEGKPVADHVDLVSATKNGVEWTIRVLCHLPIASWDQGVVKLKPLAVAEGPDGLTVQPYRIDYTEQTGQSKLVYIQFTDNKVTADGVSVFPKSEASGEAEGKRGGKSISVPTVIVGELQE